MSHLPQVALLLSPSAGYERALLRGIARYARLHGPWLLHLLGHDPQPPLLEPESLSSLPLEVQLRSRRRQAQMPDLRKLGVQGFIGRVLTPEAQAALVACAIPAIAMDLSDEQLANQRFCCQVSELSPDSHKAGRLAAEHLLERGLQNVAFFGYSGRNWSQRRQEGFCQRLAEAGLTCSLHTPPQHRTRQSWQQERPRLIAWLQSLPKPVGVMTCNDVAGRQVIEACTLAGLAVPDDVAVVGVDEDRLLCDLSNPPLSSVALNAEQGGYQAAEFLDGLMSGRVRARGQILVEPLWVVARRSTDVIAVEDPDVSVALRFIRDHARRSIGVTDVVRHAAIGRRTLEIRFHRTLGRSIREEIQRVRLGWTRQLLLETDLSLAKIAEQSGISSLSYLSKVFRRQTGVTLARYRRQHRTP